MTPEEELARMEALRTGRGEMLPPIPPPGEVLGTGEGPTDLDAEIMAAAEEAEAEEQAAAAAPPPLPAPTLAETRAALPPPIAIPQWEARRTGTRRGRTAHKVASGLIALLGGGNSYGRRVARENQQADEDYARNMRNYALQQQARKERIGLLPVLPAILEKAGLPIGMNRDEYQRYIQGGGSALERQARQQIADKEELERRFELRGDEISAADRYKKEQIEERHKRKMKEIREAGKYKGKGGMAAIAPATRNAAAQAFATAGGITVEEADEGIDDVVKGSWSTRNAKAVWKAGVNNPDLLKSLAMLRQVGAAERRDVDSATKQIQKWYVETADTRYGLKAWDAFAKDHARQINGWLQAIARDPSRKTWTDDEIKMMNLVRAPIAAFLRKMAGAAMSPQEAKLHGGMVGALLVDPTGESWLSLDGIAKRVDHWIERQKAGMGDVTSLVDRIRGEMQEIISGVIRGAPVAALKAVPREEQEAILRARLVEGWDSEDEEMVENLPEGARGFQNARLSEHRIRFDWVMPDGSTRPGLWSPP